MMEKNDRLRIALAYVFSSMLTSTHRDLFSTTGKLKGLETFFRLYLSPQKMIPRGKNAPAFHYN